MSRTSWLTLVSSLDRSSLEHRATVKLGGQRCGAVDGSAVTHIHACCPGPSSRPLQRCPGHRCNSQLTNRRARNRCRIHQTRQIELIVFIHYIRILSSVTMPTCDALLRHFRKMLLRVRIRGCTLSSLIYSWFNIFLPHYRCCVA